MADETPAPTPTPTPSPTVSGRSGNQQRTNKPPVAKPADKVVAAKPAAPAPAPVTQTPVVEEPVASPETEIQPVTDESSDDSLLGTLNELLAAFVEANTQLGQEPKDFKASAKLTIQITRFVIKYPKPHILNALLAFFREHINDVCTGENFMKGSTTLSDRDEQKVGFLYNLFAGLANQQRAKLESAQIIQVLERPEFVTFFNRRQAVMNSNSK